MTREEYEDRKRRLDEQLRAGVEMLEAGHRQQVRELDLAWMATAEEAGPSIIPLSQPATAPAPAPATPQPTPRRRESGKFQDDVNAALAHVPDVFDRNDLCRALGYEPQRGSLYRALWDLVGAGVLELADRGSGRTPSRYRKTGAATPKADG
jgi:hypothetical protein